MSDIEDEVKCSECPNARHGFDRNASHNAGRYVCQCESHKCTAESLRQQLAEANAEIERLNFKLQNQALDCIAADGQAFDSWQQLAASQLQNKQLREAIRDVCCDPDGNVCIGLMGGCYADKEVLEEALALPQDTTALEAMIAKAVEVMRDRCIEVIDCEAIRALPAVTLDDLKD